jgi:hypothetical protein
MMRAIRGRWRVAPRSSGSNGDSPVSAAYGRYERFGCSSPRRWPRPRPPPDHVQSTSQTCPFNSRLNRVERVCRGRQGGAGIGKQSEGPFTRCRCASTRPRSGSFREAVASTHPRFRYAIEGKPGLEELNEPALPYYPRNRLDAVTVCVVLTGQRARLPRSRVAGDRKQLLAFLSSSLIHSSEEPIQGRGDLRAQQNARVTLVEAEDARSLFLRLWTQLARERNRSIARSTGCKRVPLVREYKIVGDVSRDRSTRPDLLRIGIEQTYQEGTIRSQISPGVHDDG